MKKIILSISAITLLLASCGKSETCQCVDTAVSMIKEMNSAKGDMQKLKAIEDKNKPAMEKCDKLNKADSKKFEADAKKCDNYGEMEKIQKEMMK
ncbi:MAG: hypothetical protein RLZ10_1647 [Bacteroidota bacterium]|jgi:hypothetical protein